MFNKRTHNRVYDRILCDPLLLASTSRGLYFSLIRDAGLKSARPLITLDITGGLVGDHSVPPGAEDSALR